MLDDMGNTCHAGVMVVGVTMIVGMIMSAIMIVVMGVGVIEIVLILVVLIGLVIIFKSQITELLNNIFSEISKQSKEVY